MPRKIAKRVFTRMVGVLQVLYVSSKDYYKFLKYGRFTCLCPVTFSVEIGMHITEKFVKKSKEIFKEFHFETFKSNFFFSK